jgi:hypothetical protein
LLQKGNKKLDSDALNQHWKQSKDNNYFLFGTPAAATPKQKAQATLDF